MRLNTDRLFFNPFPLAIAKGLAYGLAYGTAIAFSGVQGKECYFGLVIYFMGCVCEFFEIGFFNENKSRFVKIVSRIVFVLILILALFSFCIAYNYDNNAQNGIIGFFDNHLFWVKFFPGILFVWPLATGIYLMTVSVPPDNTVQKSTQLSKKVRHGLGYRAKQ